MFEYVGDKPNPRRINKSWVFFSKGKLYEQNIVDYAVEHGVDSALFVGSKTQVVQEEPKEIVKEEKVVKKKTTKKKKKVRK